MLNDYEWRSEAGAELHNNNIMRITRTKREGFLERVALGM